MEEQNKQVEIPETLTPEQAIGILIQGVQVAQQKGVYTLADAALLNKAVDTFTKVAAENQARAEAETKLDATTTES